MCQLLHFNQHFRKYNRIEMHDHALFLQVLGLNNIKNYRNYEGLLNVVFSPAALHVLPGSLQAEIRYFEGLGGTKPR